MSLANYIRMSTAELIKLPAESFIDFYKQASEYVEISKIVNTKLKDALKAKFLPKALENLRFLGKDTGSTELSFKDYKVSVSVPKKVIWDAAAMKNIELDFPIKTWNRIVKVSYSVDERGYQKCTDHEKALLDSARTECQGSLAIKLSLGDEDEDN